MKITEIRENIAGWFFREPSKTKRVNKAYEVMSGIDHKRPFVLSISNGQEHVEALQVPKTITSPSLDEIIERVERNKDGLWRYYDGKTEFQAVSYDQVITSFKKLREKCFGQ
jgi:hypothetical protein